MVPVHHRPPAREIVLAPVLVLQIIGVLPDVVDEDREVALQRRAFVLGGAVDTKRAVLLRAREPNPAAAEYARARFYEARLELGHIAEAARERIGKGALRLTAGHGGHGAPEEAVVVMTAGVVAYGGADVCRQLRRIEQQPQR